MATEEQLIGALRKADAAGDTDGAKRIAAMIKSQRSSTPAASGGSDAGGLYAALHGFEDAATFGFGDKAAAGLAAGASHLIPGIPNQSYDQALQGIQGRSTASADAHPLAALGGDLAGIVGGGGVLASGLKAAKAIPIAGRLAEGADALLTAKKGQGIRNVAKAAVTGGALGALDAAGHDANEDQTLEATALGAVGGPIVSKIGTTVVKALTPASQKAMALLAEKIGETPDVLQRAFTQFQAATGRVPTMAELVGLKTRGELRSVAADNPTVGEAMTHARDTAEAARTDALPQRIDQIAGPTQDVNTLVTARRTRMDAAMQPLHRTTVPVDPNDLDLLNDPRIRSAFANGSPLRTRLRGVIEDLAAGNPNHDLTVQDFDQIRQAVRGRQAAYANPANSAHNPHTAREYGDLADQIGDVATQAEPGYRVALDQFASDSDYLHGFKHGMAGHDIGEAERPELIAALGRAEGARGYQSGITSRLAQQAGESNSGALRTANDLSENGATIRRVRGSLGAQTARQLQEAGHHEAYSAQALDAIAPGTLRPATEENLLGHAGQAAAAATAHSPTWIGYHLTKLFGGGKLKMSAAVQTKIAQYLSDPNMTQQGINLLRKAGASNADMARLATAIAGSTGVSAGEAVAGGQ